MVATSSGPPFYLHKNLNDKSPREQIGTQTQGLEVPLAKPLPKDGSRRNAHSNTCMPVSGENKRIHVFVTPQQAQGCKKGGANVFPVKVLIGSNHIRARLTTVELCKSR